MVKKYWKVFLVTSAVLLAGMLLIIFYTTQQNNLIELKEKVSSITDRTASRLHIYGDVTEKITDYTKNGETNSERDRSTLYFIDDDGHYTVLEKSLFYPDAPRFILTNTTGLYVQDIEGVWHKNDDSRPGPSPVLTLDRINTGSQHIKNIKKTQDGYHITYEENWIDNLPFTIPDEEEKIVDFSVTLKLNDEMPDVSDYVIQNFTVQNQETGETIERKHEILIDQIDQFSMGKEIDEAKETINNEYNAIKDMDFQGKYTGSLK